tara:strand:+ start:120 stop:1283 length:1164 start_codon:yes stop_codon:yes gene_type:complete
MKKKIAILGSTGSIGKTLINIIKKDKKNFEIVLLSADENYKELLKQAKLFKVKNLIITNKKSYNKIIVKKKSDKIKIFNNFESFKKIFRNKIDYTMSSIVGLDGLEPTINIIKYTKTLAVANKESIICGWNLINKELKKNKTRFIPVDSEHFSIWYSIKNTKISNIKRIYLTASGGPLLHTSKAKMKKIELKDVLNHPNWKMGKKISIDSSTMMNKVFEVIEAKNIFNLELNKISILIHPKSYVHAIINFNDGMIKIVAHETTMEIPIFNSLYNRSDKNYFNKNVNINFLNNLNLTKVNTKRFPIVKILKKIPEKISLYETVIVSANDELVRSYLSKKINYKDIHIKLLKILNLKEFMKLKNISPRNVSNIIKLDKYVRFKIKSKSV